MNKHIISLGIALVLSAACAQAAGTKLAWEDAKTKIIAKAQTIVKNYTETCPTIAPMYEMILSSDFQEAWDTVKNALPDFEKLEIYQKAVDNPEDDVLWQELSIQTSMHLAQQMTLNMKGDMVKAMQRNMKIGIICGTYLEVLRTALRK